jgi:starch synthase
LAGEVVAIDSPHVSDDRTPPDSRTARSISGRKPQRGVLMVASEAAPWAKTGGLADVVGALPEALDRLGHHVTLVLPRYRGVKVDGAAASFRRLVRVGQTQHDVTFHVVATGERRRVVLVDEPHAFDRAGLYGTGGRDFADNAARFALLSVAALEFAQHDAAEHPVDVIHTHDWQAGLVPVFARAEPARWPRLERVAHVFTIHNLAYQGLFPRETVPALGLPWSVFRVESGEFYSQFGFLKAAINVADYVTTVSPTYARETMTRESGAGLDGVLRARGDRYVGILNGIDTDVWNPETDPLIPARFSAADLSGKSVCKRALLARFGLPQGDDAMGRPLVGMVSRLVEQKGLDLIEAASADLIALEAAWVFVGQGEARFEGFLKALAARHPSRVGAFIGFDEGVAHLVEAGADMFLMPSRFEPCGLNQMYSLRYGTVPIVHAVGGLDDSIQPYTARARHANGFKFDQPTPDALVRTTRRAVRLYHNKAAWLPLMREGMSTDHGWQTSAREYVRVYRRAREYAAARAAG